MMASHLCALGENRFEKTAGEFPFVTFTGLARDGAPHVGDKNDILQYRIATKLTECLETPPGNPSEPSVGDAVDVDDTGKLEPSFISVKRFGPGDRGAMNVDICLRGSQESCNYLENLRIAF